MCLLAPEKVIQGPGECSVSCRKPHASPFIAASALLLQQLPPVLAPPALDLYLLCPFSWWWIQSPTDFAG